MKGHRADQDGYALAGICGIYCGTCPSYLAPRTGDYEQVQAVAQRHGLRPDEVICDGCLSSRVMKPCRECWHGFRSCAAVHHVTWCFQCAEFPCKRLAGFRDVHVKNGISHHEHVVEHLESMKAHGLSAWLDSQAEQACCTACGTISYWYSHNCVSCGAPIR